MKKAVFPTALLALALAGCGIREPLSPPQGGSLPVAPALASRAATTDELLAVTPEQRPLRVDEPLTRSTRRQADRFALPPPDVADETPPLANSSSDETPIPTDRPQ